MHIVVYYLLSGDDPSWSVHSCVKMSYGSPPNVSLIHYCVDRYYYIMFVRNHCDDVHYEKLCVYIL